MSWQRCTRQGGSVFRSCTWMRKKKQYIPRLRPTTTTATASSTLKRHLSFANTASKTSNSLSDADPLLRQNIVIDRRGIPDHMKDLVNRYVAKSPTKYSLQELMRTGRREDDNDTSFLSKSTIGNKHPVPPKHQSALLQYRGRLGQRLESERTLMRYASMLQKELPIRLAHRIDDLDNIPGLRDMPSIQAVKQLYLESLDAIVNAPPPGTDRRAEQQFAMLLDTLYRKHSSVLLQMAKGAQEFRSALKQGLIEWQETAKEDDNLNQSNNIGNNNPWRFSQQDQCQIFLDRFYTSRVGIRVLAGQYLALREQLLQGVGPPGDYVGMICKRTSPHQVVQAAVQDATRLCVEEYGCAPTVIISGRLDLTFCYIPTHLHYILMELLKNSMKATMDFHIQNNTSEEDESWTHQESFESLQSPLSKYQRVQSGGEPYLPQTKVVPNPDKIPPVTFIIADSPNNEDVIIKVMDEGGGIPRSRLDQIWSYLYTTAKNKVQEMVLQLPQANGSNTQSDGDNDESSRKDVASAAAALAKSPILAGLGFGLPMSRAFARYFGGDLDIISLEGYGTDAYVYVRRLEEGSRSTNSI
ncbi:mitochondrial branched-chain alpha-ketoacid dehydrogenase kinase [Nitzschia inconspicua]|uniref:Protein-serine/threonine kinase n=1 Tax=Nitzschia inconspicua TaxID=303405 RepID=A0A9K3Q3E2_9STRA|nr:mitochondrial branched-chain alpha-ketoacid dehydrogenase kinase [Nitzschia inconspicua]